MPNGHARVLFFELGFGVDGLPCPSAPDGATLLLLRILNLGKLCGHDDLNFTLLAGDFSENDSHLFMLLQHIEAVYIDIEANGLDVTFENVKSGDWPGCHGPGTYKVYFGDVGCGDLSWLVKANGMKSCSGTCVHITHKLCLKEPVSISPPTSHDDVVMYDERMAWYNSTMSAAASAETELREAAGGGGADVPSADITAARDAARSLRAAAENHSQYGTQPLRLWRHSMYCALHLRMLMLQLAVESMVTYAIMFDGVNVEASALTMYPPAGYVAALLLALTKMGLKCISDRIANKWSSDKRKREYESSYRLTGYAATRVQNAMSLLMDVFGSPPQRLNVSHVYVAAEGLVIGYINAMTPLMLGSTITMPEAERLVQLGEQLFVLIVLFGIGPQRRRHVGLKEHVLCRFMPWNLRRMIKRFTYCNVKGIPEYVSMGGHVFGQDASERRNKHVKKGILGNTNRHADKWAQLMSWEDVRIFGGWRTNPRDTSGWLRRETAHVLRARRATDCGFCGRADVSDEMASDAAARAPLQLSAFEKGMGFTARCCGWCRLMLRLKRECVDTKELSGEIGELVRAQSARTVGLLRHADDPLGPGGDPRASAEADTVTRDDDAACSTEEEHEHEKFEEMASSRELANALAARENIAEAASADVPECISDEPETAARPRARRVTASLVRRGI